MYPGKFYFEDGSFKLIDNDTFKTLKQQVATNKAMINNKHNDTLTQSQFERDKTV